MPEIKNKFKGKMKIISRIFRYTILIVVIIFIIYFIVSTKYIDRSYKIYFIDGSTKVIIYRSLTYPDGSYEPLERLSNGCIIDKYHNTYCEVKYFTSYTTFPDNSR